jgi:hypothetical protein
MSGQGDGSSNQGDRSVSRQSSGPGWDLNRHHAKRDQQIAAASHAQWLSKQQQAGPSSLGGSYRSEKRSHGLAFSREGGSAQSYSDTRSTRRKIEATHIDKDIGVEYEHGSNSLTRKQRQDLINKLQGDIERDLNKFTRLTDDNEQFETYIQIDGNQRELKKATDIIQEDNEMLRLRLKGVTDQLNEIYFEKTTLVEEAKELKELSKEKDVTLNKDTGKTYQRLFDAFKTREVAVLKAAKNVIDELGSDINLKEGNYRQKLEDLLREHVRNMSQLKNKQIVLDQRIENLVGIKAPSSDGDTDTRSGSAWEEDHPRETHHPSSMDKDPQLKKQWKDYLNTGRQTIVDATNTCSELIGIKRKNKDEIVSRYGESVFNDRIVFSAQCKILHQFLLEDRGEIKKIKEALLFLKSNDTGDYMSNTLVTKAKSISRFFELIRGINIPSDRADSSDRSQQTDSHEDRTAQSDSLPLMGSGSYREETPHQQDVPPDRKEKQPEVRRTEDKTDVDRMWENITYDKANNAYRALYRIRDNNKIEIEKKFDESFIEAATSNAHVLATLKKREANPSGETEPTSTEVRTALTDNLRIQIHQIQIGLKLPSKPLEALLDAIGQNDQTPSGS